MPEQRGRRRPGGICVASCAIVLLALATLAVSCRRSGQKEGAAPSPATLRIGVGQTSSTNPGMGLRQLSGLLTVESLARTGEDGRMQPWLVEGWTPSKNGRALTLKLRPNVTFHDGSPLDAATLSALLPGVWQKTLGPVFADVEGIRESGTSSVEIEFRRPSPFLLEALDTIIQKPGKKVVGTGPYVAEPDSTTAMRANSSYYLGPPRIARIQVEQFPSVRAAWAEMLRDRIDMLWEVGTDALDSMKTSGATSVFTYTRRYQYVIVLNNKATLMKPREVRRALNEALDRDGLVRNALNGYGVASYGPVWPSHWALPSQPPKPIFNPKLSAATLAQAAQRGHPSSSRLRFTCLVPPDSVNERVALDVKRQLEAIDVDMEVEEVTQDQIVQRTGRADYEAALIELVSGPTLLRPYLLWHSDAPNNWGTFGNAAADIALDRVRNSATDAEYRIAVTELLKTFVDDPPGIFLSWSVRARAVSKRFSVPAEPGRDILSTLRLWKPASDSRQASRN
jgi:peptide/nickel transport system substrate-binding protein